MREIERKMIIKLFWLLGFYIYTHYKITTHKKGKQKETIFKKKYKRKRKDQWFLFMTIYPWND